MTKFLLKFFKVIFILNVTLYILACFTPFIHPKNFWGFSFLAIGFYPLLLTMLFWLLVFLFFNRKKALLLCCVLPIGYVNLSHSIAFKTTKKELPGQKKISLLSWNVRDFNYKAGEFLNKNNQDYFNKIKEKNADIVCLQDASCQTNKYEINIFNYIKDSLGYLYSYLSEDNSFYWGKNNESKEQYGTFIFSKFPIVQANHIKYSGKNFTESLGFTDVNIDGKLIRVFNTHLRSMFINLPKTATAKQFKYELVDSNLILHSNAFKKIKYFDTSHINQVELIRKVFDTTKIPFIFCGDINSVPASFVYNKLSKGLNDAFLKNAYGWQSTHESRIPIRIDVVLHTKDIVAYSYSCEKFNLSDHYPIKVEFILPK